MASRTFADGKAIRELIENQSGKRTQAEDAFIALCLTHCATFLIQKHKELLKAQKEQGGKLAIPITLTLNEENNSCHLSSSGKVNAWDCKLNSVIPDPNQKDFEFGADPE